MSGFWRLNGVELTDVGVRVYPTRLTGEQRLRQVRTAQHQGTQDRELVGIDLPSLAIDFSLLGRGDPKFDMLAYIQDILDEDEVWTLDAPSDLSVFVYKNAKRAAMSTDSWALDNKKAIAHIGLTVNATVNGLWVADGGTFCEALSGYFTLQAGNTWLRDDGVVTGIKPLIELPDQSAGYPLATTPAFGSNFLTPTSLRVDEFGRTFKTYDLTGFLVPVPAVAGDVGVYEVCSSPTIDFLSTAVDVLIGPVGGGLPLLESCEGLLETGFGIDEGVTVLSGVHVLVVDPVARAEGVDLLTGELAEPAASETVSKAESVTVVNT